MRDRALTAMFDGWTHPSYERRVRGDTPATYLWGSAGISSGIAFDKPVLLHIRNDLFGQPITLSTTDSATAVPTLLGTLQPGECVAMELNSLSGVLASCVSGSNPLESVVAC